MAQIVSRGDSVYECDVCKRRTRVSQNKYSIDVVQRCIITYACPGKLHRITQVKEVNATPAITPAVTGLQDWFQRRVLFTHTQTIESTEWIVTHNLGTNPSIQVFDKQIDDGEDVYVETSNFTTTITDLNQTVLKFPTPTAGIAQCISFSSRNITNPNLHQPKVVVAEDIQISTAGELTIATLDTASNISLDVGYRSPVTGADTIVTYNNIDSIPSINSPWVGVSKAFIAGKTYTIRSFSLLNNLPTSVNNGSQILFPTVSTQLRQNLILLSKSPFSSPDRIYDRYIDMATLSTTQPELYYTTGNMFGSPSATRTTYPLIFVVE